jgi:DNA-directed RNA polymerase alpha subunit
MYQINMDRITDINTNGNMTTAIFRTADIAEVNMLRRAVLSEIETYAIDIVVFHINTSIRHDEIIALRLGQAVIDHSRFAPPPEGDYKSRIDFQGPGEFNTTHIPGLPFKYVTPIATLRSGQRILCDIIVKQGSGRQHVKWRPLSTFSFSEIDGGYQITIKDIGMLTGPEIIEKGFAKMATAAARPPITLFSYPLVPGNLATV